MDTAQVIFFKSYLTSFIIPFNVVTFRGHVDPGENERQAAIRETQEEAGITIDRLEIANGFEHDMRYKVKGREKRVMYWIAHLRDDQDVTLSHEHQQHEWAPLARAIELSQYKEMEVLLREAQAFLEGQ